MFFAELNDLLVNALRARLRNGEMTERGLARLVGVSQPHIHNVLKGTRTLSPELSDQILELLRMSVLDLVDTDVLRNHLDGRNDPSGAAAAHLPVLQGSVGPGQPWPSGTEGYARVQLPHTCTAQLSHPVVIRAAADARMRPLVNEGDLLLLDQSIRARTELDADALYLLKMGRGGLIRKLRSQGRSLFIVTEDALDRPAAWERVELQEAELQHLVRARVTPLPNEQQWL